MLGLGSIVTFVFLHSRYCKTHFCISTLQSIRQSSEIKVGVGSVTSMFERVERSE